MSKGLENIVDARHGGKYRDMVALMRELEDEFESHYDIQRHPSAMGKPHDRILLSAGATGAIYHVLQILGIALRDRVYRKAVKAKKPTVLFSELDYFDAVAPAKALGYNTRVADRNPVDLSFNVENYLEIMRKARPDIIWLTTPNNPTGQPISDEDLDTILRAKPKGTIAVVDRSLVNVNQEMSSKQLLDSYSNVIEIHSMSKLYNRAEYRVGFAALSNEFERKIGSMLRAGFLPALAQHSVEGVLEALREGQGPGLAKQLIRASLVQLDRLSDADITVYPSSSNFALLRLPDRSSGSRPLYTGQQLQQYLLERGIGEIKGGVDQPRPVLIMPGDERGIVTTRNRRRPGQYVRLATVTHMDEVVDGILEYHTLKTTKS